jgi:hypothetical protein
MNPRTSIAILAVLLAAALLGGCGEKDEPSASELATTSASQQTEEDFEIAGDWRGELRQKGVKPFVVTAEIAGPEGPNSVHYTGIDCSGKWTFEGRYGNDYSFHERIDRGKGGECKGSGTVTLRDEGRDELGYEFRGGGIESQGTLKPVG